MADVPVKNPGALLPVISPSEGSGELLVADYLFWHRVAWFKSYPWDADGRQPVYWHYRYSENYRRNVLYLAAAPGVELDWADALASKLPTDLAPIIIAVRVQSPDLVPEIGTPLRVSAWLGPPEHIYNGIDPVDADLSEIDRFVLTTYGRLPSLYGATLQRAPNGVKIEHKLNHWHIEFRTPIKSAGGFVFEIVQPKRDDWISRSQFRVRVVRTPGVVIDGAVTLLKSELVSEAFVDDAVVALSELPPQGSDLSRFPLRPYRQFQKRLSPKNRAEADIAEITIGMIPIIGTIADLAHVVYMEATGENIWGETVSHEEVMRQGMFALAGVFAETTDAARILKRISDRVYPGADLVSLNPGIPAKLRNRIQETVNPYLLQTMRNLGTEDQSRILTALDRYTLKIIPIEELTEVFFDVIYRAYDATVSSTLIPERIYKDALDSINPVNLESFRNLTPQRQRDLIEAHAEFAAGARSAALLMADFDTVLRREFQEHVDEWRVFSIFNVMLDGFRDASLIEGFARYRTRGGKRTAITWTLNQFSGIYSERLKAILGSDFRALIRTVAPEKYLEITNEAIDSFNELGNRPNFYSVLAAKNKFGHLFEADHLLEQRFMKRRQLDEFLIPLEDFQALLVPKNPKVAAQLPSHYYYIHSVKTDLLRKLIPHGTEATFTLQEIFDAYMIVFIYQLKVDKDVVIPLLFDVFQDMRVASQKSGLPESLNRTIVPLGTFYRRNPNFARLPE
jgi:hypothetical protein